MRSGKFGRRHAAGRRRHGDKAGQPVRLHGLASQRPDGGLFHEQGAAVFPCRRLRGPRCGRSGGGLAYFRVEARQSKSVPRASDEQQLATYPAWSPDGRYLYYCSAPVLWDRSRRLPPEQYAEVKYDLMRIAYDIADGPLGRARRRSCRPRDRAEHPPAADLARRPVPAVLHVPLRVLSGVPADERPVPAGSGQRARMRSARSTASSPSRGTPGPATRGGSPSAANAGAGLFTRCFLSFVDETGQTHKPFVVPQRDPEFYDSLLKTFSVPELVTGPVRIPESVLVRAARSPDTATAQVPSGGRRRTCKPPNRISRRGGSATRLV